MSEVTRFQSKAPTFQTTDNPNALEATTPQDRDTAPAPSIVERVEQTGNLELAALLEKLQQDAKAHARVIEAPKRVPRKRTQAPTADSDTPVAAAPTLAPMPLFQESDVVDDATFIRKTRDGNVHTPEMRALFWANGGAQHLVGGLSYAQAFDNLRREKMRNLQGGVKASTTPYQRHSTLQPGAKVRTPGIPTQADRKRRHQAEQQTRVVATHKWDSKK